MRQRIVGGKITKITHGNHFINAREGNITHNAATSVFQQGEQEGVSYGNYESHDSTLHSNFLIRGWWTDENDKPISEALLGDVVKFHLETKNIPDGELVFITLYDDDRRVKPLEEDEENDKIRISRDGKEVIYGEVKNNKLVETLNLSGLKNLINQEKDGVAELFFACSYQHPKMSVVKENRDFPIQPNDYLKVKGMPKILFVNGHWNIAHYVPFGGGKYIGPTEPLKPYWIPGISDSFINYLDKEFSIMDKNKYTLNNKNFKTEELEDKNYILYIDGSSKWAGDQSGLDRFKNGRNYAEEHYEEIIEGLGNESIYLVSHSEGGAFAAGMADFLFEQKHTIGEHILLSPDEGDEFEIKPEIPSYQLLYMFFSTEYTAPIIKGIKFKKWDEYYAIVDWIVGEYKIKGITKMGIVHNQNAGWGGVHGWTNSNSIFDKVSDLKNVNSFLAIGERKGEYYSGQDHTKTKNNTKFYRIDDEYIVTNCPPFIEIT